MSLVDSREEGGYSFVDPKGREMPAETAYNKICGLLHKADQTHDTHTKCELLLHPYIFSEHSRY